MKTSIKLLLILAFLSVAGMISSNVMLKNQYYRLNKNDKFWNYKTLSTQPFRYLIIEGNSKSIIEIKQSDTIAVRHHNYLKDTISYSFRGDSLFLKINTKNTGSEYRFNYDFRSILISAPNIKSVASKSIPFEIKNFEIIDLNLDIKNGSRAEIRKSKIKNLNVSLKNNSIIDISIKSMIENVQVSASDSSTFMMDKISPKTISIQADPKSYIHLSGETFSKLLKN